MPVCLQITFCVGGATISLTGELNHRLDQSDEKNNSDGSEALKRRECFKWGDQGRPTGKGQGTQTCRGGHVEAGEESAVCLAKDATPRES